MTEYPISSSSFAGQRSQSYPLPSSYYPTRSETFKKYPQRHLPTPSSTTMIRFDTLPPEVTQAMCTPMHLILPSSPSSSTGALYLGSLSAVMDKDLLREHQITHLVHVLDVPWLPMAEKEGFVGYKIAIADQENEDLRPHLEAVCNHIDSSLKSGRNVLVHCHQGVSRSAAVVIAYLIRNQGMTFDNAHSFLKRQRACIKPNSGFMRALQEWESYWRRPNMSRRFTT